MTQTSIDFQFIKLNYLPPLDVEQSSIPRDYFSCEWDNFYFLSSSIYVTAEDWMYHVFSHKGALITFCWETGELVVRHKYDAYLTVCESGFDTEKEVEDLAESFIDWLVWNEPSEGQLPLPLG